MFLHQKWLRKKISIQQSKKKSIPGWFCGQKHRSSTELSRPNMAAVLTAGLGHGEKSQCSATFWTAIRSAHFALLSANPRPRIERWASQEKTSRKVNVTIALFSVRSMASREKFYLVKQTIVHDNYDMFVIFESWLDPSRTNNDI